LMSAAYRCEGIRRMGGRFDRAVIGWRGKRRTNPSQVRRGGRLPLYATVLTT